MRKIGVNMGKFIWGLSLEHYAFHQTELLKKTFPSFLSV